MSSRRRWSWLFAGLLGCAASADPSSEPLGESAQAIIYGQDDRQEVYEHPDPILRGLAHSSAVALIPRSRFGQRNDGDFAIFAPRLSQAFQVCSDQRFVSQPTAADCSGVLIDDDLVLTAGHCFATDDACDRFAFVFDYYYKAADTLEGLSWGDIYGCRRVVDRSLSNGGDTRVDYAVVQLDRVPLGRTPVPVRATPLTLNEPLATIGCVSGLPLKIDSGGQVLGLRSTTLDFFLLDSDTFAGSSGSGVFDRNAQLVGVLVRGGQDYVPRPDAGCMVPNVVQLDQVAAESDAGGLDRGQENDEDAGEAEDDAGVAQATAVRVPSGGVEEATYVARAIDGICGRGWPSPRLCGATPRCGDGYCTAGETRTSCASDCGCTGSDCASGPADLAAAAGAPVSKSKATDGGCAAHPGGPGTAWSALLLVGALSPRRRRRPA